MPAWVRANSFIRPSWCSPVESVAISPASAAFTMGSFANSGSIGARRLISLNTKAICGGMGASLHRVPSLSNTAIRSGMGTKSALPSVAVRFTKSRMACLAGPSFQLASGSVVAATAVSAVVVAVAGAGAGPWQEANSSRQPANSMYGARAMDIVLEWCSSMVRWCIDAVRLSWKRNPAASVLQLMRPGERS